MGLLKATKKIFAQKFDSKTAGLAVLGGKIADSTGSAFDRTKEGTASILSGIKDLSKKAGQAVKETASKVGQGVRDLKHEMDDADAVRDQIYYKMASIKSKATNLFNYLWSVYTNNGKDADPKKIATATELWHELITLALYPTMKKMAYHGSNEMTSYDTENSRARKIVRSYIAHQRAVNSVTDKDTDTKIRFDIDKYMSTTPQNLQKAVRVRPGKLLSAIASEKKVKEDFANAPKKHARKTKRVEKTPKASLGRAKTVKKTAKTKSTRPKNTRGIRELHSLAF